MVPALTTPPGSLMSRRLAAPVLAAVLLVGCATVPAPSPSGPPEAVRPAPSGRDVEAMLASSGLRYVTLEPDQRWMIAFAGRHRPHIVVHVLHGDRFTIVLGRLFTVPAAAGVEFYRLLALKNYAFDQLKLSVDEEGGCYASLEVPRRLLDTQELLENVFGLAGVIDAVTAELAPAAGAEPEGSEVDADPLDDALPPSPRRPVPLPGPIIEARL